MRAWPLLAVLVVACSARSAAPVAIDTANDACRQCRMIVSDARLGGQVIAPAEEPWIFDDIGCLRAYLAAHPAPPGSSIYVADHRTGTWIAADEAVYTRVRNIATPMGSGIIAHADGESKDADPAAREGLELALAWNTPR